MSALQYWPGELDTNSGDFPGVMQMRRWLMVVIAAVVAWGAMPGAATAQVDLGAVVLAVEEVGTGFTTVQAGPVDQAEVMGVPSYLAVYARMPGLLNFSFDAVAIALVDDSAAQATGQDGLAAAIDAQLGALAAFGVTATPVPAPEIGRETLRYRLDGAFSGITLSGDAIIWRQGSLIAGIAAIGTRNPSAEARARAQALKLWMHGIAG